jgi:hypothetical protein
MATTNTFYFEDIFADYADFKEMTDGLELYDSDPESETYDAVAENYNQYLYDLLYLRYAGNSINYDVPQYFVYAFGLRYKNIFDKYKKQLELIKKVEDLTEDELELLTETISNGAYNPNDQPVSAWAPINYVSQQNRSRLKNNKLIAYINAINAIPTKNIEGFLDAFIDLFTMFMPDYKYIY